jgi:hypothetical protein
LALRADAGLEVHFVHGVNVLALSEGQGAALWLISSFAA